MKFQEYLAKTKEIATEEKSILDELSKKDELTKIEIRAAKSSLQTMIENSIGKAKKILKYFNCPVVPARSKNAVTFMYDMDLIDDELYQALIKAIGFRNAMIHDYMQFNEDILKEIVKDKFNDIIYNFLIEKPNYTEVQLSRVKNFTI